MTDKGKYTDVSSFEALYQHGIEKAVIAIGVFDGVHRGHQLLISELLKMAEAEKAAPVALTFYPHPREILSPESSPRLLTAPAKKIKLLHDYGVSAVVTIPFTKEFAALSAPEFINDCLISEKVLLCGICVGRQWRFGSGGQAGNNVLKDFAEKGHFNFKAVDELYLNDREISSTSIRKAVSSGLLDEAAEMLGRPYSLTGTVEKGNMIAGSELECPTANLRIKYGVLPPSGVYAGRAFADGKSYTAAVALGYSPTYRHYHKPEARVEVHIFDFNGNIYGKEVEVEFIKYLREERCFSSPENLKKQIESDLIQIREIMEKNNG